MSAATTVRTNQGKGIILQAHPVLGREGRVTESRCAAGVERDTKGIKHLWSVVNTVEAELARVELKVKEGKKCIGNGSEISCADATCWRRL